MDSVNLFNGNLVIRIPLGMSYPVNAGLSYQLGLTYNNNVWDYQQRVTETFTYTQAIPNGPPTQDSWRAFSSSGFPILRNVAKIHPTMAMTEREGKFAQRCQALRDAGVEIPHHLLSHLDQQD